MNTPVKMAASTWLNPAVQKGVSVSMSKLFKPGDFEDDNGGYGPYAKRLADIANTILAERSVRAYYANGWWVERDNDKGIEPTHQGLLTCIEELPKKECKHEPVCIKKTQEWLSPGKLSPSYFNWECIHCRVPLKAQWSSR